MGINNCMRNKVLIVIILCWCCLTSCIFVAGDQKKTLAISTNDSLQARRDTIPIKKDSFQYHATRIDSKPAQFSIQRDTAVKKFFSTKEINTRKVDPLEVVTYAKTLIGIPYRYGSTDPKVGFDCSGFFTYVFTHFNIVVPRSSIDFTEVGVDIPFTKAKIGDLILFTGTDSTEKFVGHMGMIVSNENGAIQFIHSTSGKQYGVTITPFSGYYKGRYVKTIRIFPENG